MYFLGFDTEDRGNHDPYLFALYGDVCYEKGGHHKGQKTTKTIERVDIITNNIEDILKVLNKRVKDTYLVGFNLSYDLNNIYPEYNRERNMWKGKFNGFKEHNHGKIKGLEMAGKWFQGIGLKALSEKFNVEYIDEHKPDSPKIKEACRSHAKSIYEITKQLEELFNEIGYTMQYSKYSMPTSSGMAFNTWCEIENQDHKAWDKSKNVLAALSYHGGWCDVFINSLVEHAQHYDVVSMYPSVMIEKEYPTPDIPFTKGNPDLLNEYLKTKAGFAIGIITTPNILISPFTKISEQKLIFPIGTWATTLTFPEIEYLYELGGSFKCTEVYYTEKWHPFINYVNKFYELKKQKKTKEIGKLLLNGLSGKFGQKIRPDGEYIEISKEEMEKVETGEFGIKTFYVCGKNYEYLKPEIETIEYSYYPLISSYITAYARIKLHKMMNIIGYENIIYCDTDSLIVKEKIPDEFITASKELGKWEHEGVDVKILAIAPKKYREFRTVKDKKVKRWELRANGIPRKMQHCFWRNPYKPITYKQPLSFKQALRRHALPNQWVQVIKIHTPSFKRTFLSDGTSKPFKEVL